MPLRIYECMWRATVSPPRRPLVTLDPQHRPSPKRLLLTRVCTCTCQLHARALMNACGSNECTLYAPLWFTVSLSLSLSLALSLSLSRYPVKRTSACSPSCRMLSYRLASEVSYCNITCMPPHSCGQEPTLKHVNVCSAYTVDLLHMCATVRVRVIRVHRLDWRGNTLVERSTWTYVHAGTYKHFGMAKCCSTDDDTQKWHGQCDACATTRNSTRFHVAGCQPQAVIEHLISVVYMLFLDQCLLLCMIVYHPWTPT